MTRCIIVMGIAGSGKSTVGRALADELGWVFVEGDDLHPVANVEKMAAGTPLDDEDRWPWLDALSGALGEIVEEGPGVVASCSALKAAHRDRLRARLGEVVFVYLAIDEAVATQRLESRPDHYMGASMIASQVDALEAPSGEETIAVDATLPVAEVLSRTLDALAPGGTDEG